MSVFDASWIVLSSSWTFWTPCYAVVCWWTTTTLTAIILSWWERNIRLRSWLSRSIRLNSKPINFFFFFISLISTSSWISISVWMIHLERSVVARSLLSCRLCLLTSPRNAAWFSTLNLATPSYSRIRRFFLLLIIPCNSVTWLSLMRSNWRSLLYCFLVPRISILLIISRWF